MSAARLRVEWAILLALAIAGAILSQVSGLTGRLDNQLLDRAAAVSRPAIADDIVVVAIDDQSLADIGAWPWPRAVHARILDRLTEAGARIVMLDVLFIEPTTPEDDAALAEAIARHGSVFLPHSFTTRPNALAGEDPLLPLPTLAEASAGIGHVVAVPDTDGVLRRFDLVYETDEGRYPHATSVLAKSAGATNALPAFPDRAIIPFNPEASFPHESAANILTGSTIDGFFDDKIVLVGATAPGLGDRYSVATGSVGLMTGVGTQANLINALRNGDLITPVGFLAHAVVAALVLVLLFLAFWRLPPRFVLICAITMAASVLIGSLLLLTTAGLWFAPGSILIAIILSYPMWSWRRLSHVSRYLDREAARLTSEGDAPLPGEGLDYVTRQVEQLRRLISTVRGSLSFLREVIEAAPDAILVLDRDGRVEMANDRAAGLFPAWNPKGRPTLADLISRGGAVLTKEGAELESADKRTFLVARAEIMEESRTGASGEIIALRDVSELRRLDDERQQMLEFLSHDMRTPQVAIVGLTQNAGDLGGKSDIVARIRAQAERTLKLADDFVQLARLNSPSMTLSDSDVGSLVAEACDRAYSQASTKRISIDQNVPEEPWFAVVDASLIARMLDNLIGNAIKYSAEETTVRVALSGGTGESTIIEVADEGPGLSEARQADPFARFGAHATNAGPSAGLGLALVKKVVDAHKGTITLHSVSGEGTTFTVTLP